MRNMEQSKGTALIVSATAPLTITQELPDYLKTVDNKNTGLEGLTKDDFRIPEIKLMQGLSPELDTYKGVAVKDEFFHTGMMKSIGNTYRGIICVVKKRVVVWRPKNDQGGGILAVSDDSISWKMGANKEFTVMLKGAKKPVTWKIGPNVKASGLLEFGTSDPENENSSPAAVQYFEYVEYLPDYENASPAVKRVKSTGLDNARKLNSYFLLQGKKIYVHALQWTAELKKGSNGDWTVPLAKPIGFVDKRTFEIVQEMHNQYAAIDLTIDQEGDIENKDPNSPAF